MASAFSEVGFVPFSDWIVIHAVVTLAKPLSDQCNVLGNRFANIYTFLHAYVNI